MFRQISIFVALLVGVSLLAVAADDPIAQRQALMKDVRGGAKDIGGMLRGDAPFDADLAMQGLMAWRKAAQEFGDLFPDGTQTGGDTEALPSIWEDREGFEKALAAFGEATEAAIAADPQSLEALKGAAGPVFNKCKACHEDYRAED